MKRRSLYKAVTLVILLIVTFITFSYVSRKSDTFTEISNTEIELQKEVQEENTPEIVKPKPFAEGSTMYIEITDSCDHSSVGSCVNLRGGPGIEYTVVARLRTGIILQVAEIISVDGRDWYKIKVDEDIRFPERVEGGWYIAAGDYIHLFDDIGTELLSSHNKTPTTKRIIVDLSEQTIYAYDGEELFMKELISTGLKETPTPRGTFTIFKKTPSRYMQGPIIEVSDQYYDLPGVPWNLYFTAEGAVIHGAYWHDSFGQVWSHGCVNLSPATAKRLYEWTPVGTPVIVQN